MSNETFELKLYQKNNKCYLLNDLYEWPDEKIFEFAKLLERQDKDRVIFSNSPNPGIHLTKHRRLNDYIWSDSYYDGTKTASVEEVNWFGYTGDLVMVLSFSEPEEEDYDYSLEYVRFVLNPAMTRLVQRNCVLSPDEIDVLKMDMEIQGVPTDKNSVDNEIKNCVGLYEYIQD